jgi:hypothetical protein
MKRLFTSSVSSSSSKKKNEPSSSSVSSKNDPVELLEEEEEMSTSATIGSGGPKMDRYGFFVDESKSSSSSIVTTGKINMVQLRSDAQKWESRLDKVDGKKNNNQRGSVDATYSTNPSKMKYYTRRGLPDGMRKKAWTSLTGVDLIIKAHSGMYDELVNSASARYENLQSSDNGNSNSNNDNNTSSDINNFDMGTVKAAMETIDRDIHRTYPKHFLFCGGG